MTSGKIELRTRPIDLREAIQHAIEVSRPLIEQREQKLTVSMPDAPIAVNGDAVEQYFAFGRRQ